MKKPNDMETIRSYSLAVFYSRFHHCIDESRFHLSSLHDYVCGEKNFVIVGKIMRLR